MELGMNKAIVLLIRIALVSSILSGLLHAQDWEDQPPTKQARSEASAITYQGQVYVFNGFAPRIRIEPTIERFNPANGQWRNTKVQLKAFLIHP